MRLWGPDRPRMSSDASSRSSPGAHRLPFARQRVVCSRRQWMTAQPRATNVWWMWSRISQRMRRRRNRAAARSLLPRPSGTAQPGSVPGGAPGDVRGDLEPADLVLVDLVVISAVGAQVLGVEQRPAALAADRRDGLDQRDQLGDVVAVVAGGDWTAGAWPACSRHAPSARHHKIVLRALMGW